ncbi:aromatic amino acid exporter YddG [Azospirillum picis]|uniref:Drug/metabolite transporter (DMT)-like permease n=1 Tax=Azospirillum picis TaxID=488438 RepID=A0ABU0MHR8_9PROT|nr:EamA family transporter [Azospirillum picis]MBP2299365.1 drug/metabolite transporter (DMT)-like permease [Azospirillum picis]MDQ0532997.1 drug/metabolite transporter (DMT)-like permease [Azospirillum picis]
MSADALPHPAKPSPPAAGDVRRATGIGAIAILLWSTAALLTSLSSAMPPLQLVAVTFGLAFAAGTAIGLARGRDVLAAVRQPLPVWLVGVGGLFGYHACLFLAFHLAPDAAVEVNLLNYLWPLCIVLFSALLPGERLKLAHVAGALCGLAGTMLILAGRGGGLHLEGGNLPAYAAALSAALIWGAYSVLSRRFGNVPTEAVSGFCLVTAMLGLAGHLLFEDATVWPQQAAGWLALLALGLGPDGLAFFVWDHGMKRGDIRALGVMSYAVPPASTLLLILFGQASGNWSVWAACALIAGGAVMASWDVIRGRSRGGKGDAGKAGGRAGETAARTGGRGDMTGS